MQGKSRSWIIAACVLEILYGLAFMAIGVACSYLAVPLSNTPVKVPLAWQPGSVMGESDHRTEFQLRKEITGENKITRTYCIRCPCLEQLSALVWINTDRRRSLTIWCIFLETMSSCVVYRYWFKLRHLIQTRAPYVYAFDSFSAYGLQ